MKMMMYVNLLANYDLLWRLMMLMRLMMLDHTQILRRHSHMFRLCLWSSTEGGGLFQRPGELVVMKMVFVERNTTYRSYWISQDVLNSSKSKKTDIKSRGLLVLGGFNMDHVTEVSNMLHNHYELIIIAECICQAFRVSMAFVYINVKEYPRLTTFHPNLSQPIPPFSE